MLNDPRSSQFLCPNCRAHADLDADIEEPELEYLEDDDDEEFVDAINGSMSNNASPPESPQASDSVRTGEEIPSINRVMSNGTEPELYDRSVSDASENLGFLSLSPTRSLEPFSTPTITTSNSNGRLEPHSPTTPTIPHARLPPPPSRGLDPTASAFVPSGSNPADNRQTLAAPVPIDGNSGLWHPETGVRTPPDPTSLVREGPMTPRNTAGPFVFDGSAAGENSEDGAATTNLDSSAAT